MAPMAPRGGVVQVSNPGEQSHTWNEHHKHHNDDIGVGSAGRVGRRETQTAHIKGFKQNGMNKEGTRNAKNIYQVYIYIYTHKTPEERRGNVAEILHHNSKRHLGTYTHAYKLSHAKQTGKDAKYHMEHREHGKTAVSKRTVFPRSSDPPWRLQHVPNPTNV